MREIQNLTEPSQWSYCSGAQNPADVATRGVTIKKLIESTLCDSQGRAHVEATPDLSTNDMEKTNVNDMEIDESINVAGAEDICEDLMNLNKSSNLSRVLRVTAWIQRICKNAQGEKLTGPLTTEELFRAESY